MTPLELPLFVHTTKPKPMTSPTQSVLRRKLRRAQQFRDFAAAAFFTMVFAIVVHMAVGR